jgi:hypothetical protein
VNNEFSFKPGEKISYEIAYNWGILWVNAGEVKFKADTITHYGKKAFFFTVTGNSYKYYDWIFRVRDRFQSIVDAVSLQPVWFRSDIAEGGHEAQNTYHFQSDNKSVNIEKTESGKKSADTIQIPACTFDILSATYYARSLDFSDYKPGDRIPVNLIIDGQYFELFIRYLGKETIENRAGNKYVCIKFSAVVVEGTIFKGGENLIVWVTDDKNKIPVMAEAQILVGSVKAYLVGYEGLKSSMDAEVEDKREEVLSH